MTDPQGSDIHPVAVPQLDADVRAFREADGDAQRATVLLTAPVSTLLRWREVFERMCATVGFKAGSDYLAALSAASRARRHRGGFGTMESEGAKTILLHLSDGGRWEP